MSQQKAYGTLHQRLSSRDYNNYVYSMHMDIYRLISEAKCMGSISDGIYICWLLWLIMNSNGATCIY